MKIKKIPQSEQGNVNSELPLIDIANIITK